MQRVAVFKACAPALATSSATRLAPAPRQRNTSRGATHKTRAVQAVATQKTAMPAVLPRWEPAANEADEYGPLVLEMENFLKEDLDHLFDDKGIDASRYDDKVEFMDPITRYSSIQGYLFNIQMLRRAFDPKFVLLGIARSGPLEITTRWTMEMSLSVVPPFLRPLWSPSLVFTGVSIMSINPETRKISRHLDRWDSVNNNEYLSTEAVADLFKQLVSLDQAPALETPAFQILKRTAGYEVRAVNSFLVAETDMGERAGVASGGGFNDLAGYIFGGNAAGEKMEMTTPVFTQSREGDAAGPRRAMQFVLESKWGRDPGALPAPSRGGVMARSEPARVVAVAKFGGIATDDETAAVERRLRAALIADGLRPTAGYTLARYNDPFTPSFLRRNEVQIGLEDYVLS